MSYRADWRFPALWLALSCVKIGTLVSLLSRRGMHDYFAVFDVIVWPIAAVILICRFSWRWTITADTLVWTRFPFPRLAIPFSSISSVDWGKYNQGSAMVRYNKGGKARKTYVQVTDMPGLLDELEQRVSAGVMHV